MIVARAPNHLGDGVMALPALEALASLGPLRIHAPPGLRQLFAGIAPVEPPGVARPDLAVVFPPSLSSVWKLKGARRRVGAHHRWLLTDPVEPAGHRGATYAALAVAAGAHPAGAPSYAPRGVAAEVPEGHIALNPLTRGGPPRTWWGWGALASTLGRSIVFYGGPDEARALRPFEALGDVVVGLSLPDLAATLQRCALFVSSDTGPAHLARAVGVETLVLYLSTIPERTGPAGAHAVFGPRPGCAPCYRNRCTEDLSCAGLSVDRVAAAIEALL